MSSPEAFDVGSPTPAEWRRYSPRRDSGKTQYPTGYPREAFTDRCRIQRGIPTVRLRRSSIRTLLQHPDVDSLVWLSLRIRQARRFDDSARCTLFDSDPNQDDPVLSDAARAEIQDAIAKDDTQLGDVYRRGLAGETPEQMAEARGVQYSNFVWTQKRIVKAAIDGDLIAAPTVAIEIVRAIRRLLAANDFSDDAKAVLEHRLAILERRAADPVERAAEDKKAIEQTNAAEDLALPGIYVYSLPHYLRHPYDVSGRTLMKVGRADRSVIKRFREQTRTTALPEDPVLLRVYETSEADAANAERSFHRLLEAADHDRSAARTGGTEWFLTSVRFLDEIATLMGLRVNGVTDLGDYVD